jgi:hypothetical protein
MKLLSVERRWMHGVLDAMFPRGASDQLPLGIMELDVDGFIEDLIGSQRWVGAMGIRASFAFVALSPLVTLRKPATVGRLSAEEKERAFGALYKSRFYVVRQLVMLAKATGAMLYCAAPQARRVMVGGGSGQEARDA